MLDKWYELLLFFKIHQGVGTREAMDFHLEENLRLTCWYKISVSVSVYF